MIRINFLPDGRRQVVQESAGPTIYLDQWMWHHLSKDANLRNEFIKIASTQHSCIMYSIASLMEIAQIEDKNQLFALEQIMDSVDFAFLEADPIKVIHLEENHRSEEAGIFIGRHPAADHELLDYLIRQHRSDLSKMSPILEDLKKEAPARYATLAEHLKEKLNPIIEHARSNPKTLTAARANNMHRHKLQAGPPYTSDILNLLISHLVANKTMTLNKNDWMDMLHLVVPVAYLNFATLDKRWIHFVRKCLPLRPPNIAAVYGPTEIESFLESLSTFTDRNAIR